MANKQFIRRAEAGEYLKNKFGFCSAKSLAKLATVGGGPEFRKAGKAVLYEIAALDAWAMSRISAPQKSTSDRPEAA